MADVDGNIKLGVSVDIDAKSVTDRLKHMTSVMKDAFSGIYKHLTDTSSAFNDIKSNITDWQEELKIAQNNVRSLKENYDELLKTDTPSGVLKSARTDIVKAENEVKNLQTSINEAQAQLSEEAPVNLLDGLKGQVPGIASSFLGLGKTILKAFTVPLQSSIGLLGKLRKTADNSIGGIGKKFLKAMIGVRGLYMLFRKLRQMAVTAIKDMASQIPELNSQLSETKTLWAGMKGAVGTMIQPLLSAVLPVINQIIAALTTAITKVGEFFAALTGQGFIYKATAAQQNFAGAVKDTNKALGAYDKLNVISQDKGGGGAGGTGVTYNKQDVSDSISEFAQMIKDAWEKADFTEVGKLIGEKLNGLITEIRTNYIPKIDEFAMRLASSIATFVNGLVSVQGLAENIGGLIADAFNIVIHFFDVLLTKFDTQALGKFITTGLYAGVLAIDWGSLGHALGELVIKFWDIITGLIEGIPWGTIVYDIWDIIVDFVKGVPWQGIFDSLVRVLDAVVNAFATVIPQAMIGVWQLIKGAWKMLVDWWHEIAYEDGQFTIAGLLHGIDMALVGIVMWVWNHIFKPFIDAFKSAFGIHSPSTVMMEMGEYLIEGLKLGIGNVWEKIKQTFLDTKQKLSDTWNNIKTTAIIVWNTIKTSLSTTANTIKSTLTSVFTSVKTSLGSIFDGIWSKIRGVLNSILGGVERMVNGVISGINQMGRSLNAMSFEIPSWVPWFGGNSFNLHVPTLSSVSIPKLAQGAVIPPNREFLAMLGDQTSGTNIEAPLETIQQALANVLAQSGSNKPIVLQLNGKDIARVVWDENEKRYKQTGLRYSY